MIYLFILFVAIYTLWHVQSFLKKICTIFRDYILSWLKIFFLQIQTWKATTYQLAMVKEEGVNTFKVGSIEEYVQQNQEDIIDLRYIMDAT